MEALRTAVVGTGFIGRVHARSARLAGARWWAWPGRRRRRAEAAAALGAERAFASGEELVEADGIDVVHIAPPTTCTSPWRSRRWPPGKHVVLEKPVALDGAGAQPRRRRGEAGLVVAVPFAYRFHPMIREARARVAAGELGRLRLLHGHYQQDWLLTPDDVNWRVDAALGGASGPSPTSARTGATWSSSCRATASPGCWPAP